ncbi:glycerate kinase [Amycolatopsis sp. PS_44_ISF1]|uniref:glycerate kinase n=1 Tax=Amycolatopsis sp. PS_44_ISF1 TaxID=2974917 RepID=UPI0028E0670D|nr:glycerate kinase [Amycolatopsis sp. PS_44_ISF1]MDT8911784.1 glycerate kinase [Amycolatopsis sp. PS_44_ISF1]
MTVLVAPDKFKGSLTAAEVAAVVAEGFAAVSPEPVRQLPVADGGDGTVEAAVAAGFRRVPARVHGPTGRRTTAYFALRGEVAVVELAEASGLHRLPGGVRQPLTASSTGTGELIAAAVAAGASEVVLGVGGSACTDGGAGMLTALGARLLDASGSPLPPGGAALASLSTVDFSGMVPVTISLASDVDNPLLGPTGAAAVYGPQKGASPQDVVTLERGLRRLAEVVGPELAESPGAGAAGGVGFAALAVLGARMSPGSRLVLELLGFADAVRDARLVVTGEGSLDEQSLRGKAPVGVLRAATASGVPVVAVVGRCLLPPERWRAAGFTAVYALTEVEPDADRCVAQARSLLRRRAEQLAREHRSHP